MIGYKAFENDWTCRNFKYEVGKTYEMPKEDLKICSKGFHFSKNLIDCFTYYPLKPYTKVAKVKALGEVQIHDSVLATNKIEILEEIPIKECFETLNKGSCNEGYFNEGFGNIGNFNKGKYNCGDSNSGHRNKGNRNYGDSNSGILNVGTLNIGNNNKGRENAGYNNLGNNNIGSKNFGDRNFGDRNFGNNNIGNDNFGSYNNGDNCFGSLNTMPSFIYLFNKPTNITKEQWESSYVFQEVLCSMPPLIEEKTEEINPLSESTDKQIKEKLYYTFGLERKSNIKNRQLWYEKLSDNDKAAIQNIPNFDPKIFKKATGIDTLLKVVDTNE